MGPPNQTSSPNPPSGTAGPFALFNQLYDHLDGQLRWQLAGQLYRQLDMQLRWQLAGQLYEQLDGPLRWQLYDQLDTQLKENMA